jgi:hypothetical protein
MFKWFLDRDQGYSVQVSDPVVDCSGIDFALSGTFKSRHRKLVDDGTIVRRYSTQPAVESVVDAYNHRRFIVS